MTREEKLEYDRRWREKNRDKIRASQRKWRAANLEQDRKASRERRRANYEIDPTAQLAASMKWKKANAERDRKRKRDTFNRVKYGVSPAQYDQMVSAAGGACPGCLESFTVNKAACIDHDHFTGTVRGVLCRSCNWAIGHIRDNPESLERLAAYLRAAEMTHV